jgi:hypothetical protein
MREFTSEPGASDQVPLALKVVEFKLDGQVFRAMEEVTGDALLEWSELGIAAADDVDIDSPEGVSYLARFLRAAFGASEYQRFRRHIRTHRTDPATVMAIVAEIQAEMAGAVETVTDRPTEPSSPSSDGDAGQDGQRARVINLGGGEVQWVDPPKAVPQDYKAKGGKPRAKRAAAGGTG